MNRRFSLSSGLIGLLLLIGHPIASGDEGDRTEAKEADEEQDESEEESSESEQVEGATQEGNPPEAGTEPKTTTSEASTEPETIETSDVPEAEPTVEEVANAEKSGAKTPRIGLGFAAYAGIGNGYPGFSFIAPELRVFVGRTFSVDFQVTFLDGLPEMVPNHPVAVQAYGHFYLSEKSMSDGKGTAAFSIAPGFRVYLQNDPVYDEDFVHVSAGPLFRVGVHLTGPKQRFSVGIYSRTGALFDLNAQAWQDRFWPDDDDVDPEGSFWLFDGVGEVTFTWYL